MSPITEAQLRESLHTCPIPDLSPELASTALLAARRRRMHRRVAGSVVAAAAVGALASASLLLGPAGPDATTLPAAPPSAAAPVVTLPHASAVPGSTKVLNTGLGVDGRGLVLRLDVESPLGINEVVADLEPGAQGTIVYGSSVAYERGDAGSGGWTQTPVLRSATGSDPWEVTGDYVVYAVLPEGALTATAELRDGTTTPLATAVAPWAPDRHVGIALITAPVKSSNKGFDGLAAEDLPVRNVVFGDATN